MEFLNRVFRQLVLHDAFTLEVNAFEDPWFPSEDIFYDAYHTFMKEVFAFFGSESFFACVVEVSDGVNVDSKEIILCYSPRDNERIESHFKEPIASLVDFIVRSVSDAGSSSSFGAAVQAWLDKSKNKRLVIAPYIVQPSEYVRQAKEQGVLSTKELFQQASVDGKSDDFLYTKPALFPKVRTEFNNPYYNSVMLIGVDDSFEAQEGLLCDVVETLSVMFQMSWGYPQLIRERERMAKQKGEQEQALKSLDHFRKASDIARELAAALGPAFKKADLLNRILKPLPSALITTYEKARPYIPRDDNTRFFDRWTFNHDWVGKIPKNQESFKAQMACILLAYAGAHIPQPLGGAQWQLNAPWQLLKDSLVEVEKFGKIFPAFLDTMQKIENPEEVTGWIKEDEEAFRILKGCFYYPFKKKIDESPNRLTGPLMLLWTLDYGGNIYEENIQPFLTDKAFQGDGWPKLEILPAIYSFIYFMCANLEKYELVVRPNIDDQGSCDGVNIKVFISEEATYKSIKASVAKVRSASIMDSWDLLGNFHASVNTIYSEKGNVKFVEDGENIVEIEFPIS